MGAAPRLHGQPARQSGYTAPARFRLGFRARGDTWGFAGFTRQPGRPLLAGELAWLSAVRGESPLPPAAGGVVRMDAPAAHRAGVGSRTQAWAVARRRAFLDG